MTNRISQYCGGLSDVRRAQDSLAFCEAILRSQNRMSDIEAWEIDALSRLQTEAVCVYRDFGLPLPWESGRAC